MLRKITFGSLEKDEEFLDTILKNPEILTEEEGAYVKRTSIASRQSVRLAIAAITASLV